MSIRLAEERIAVHKMAQEHPDMEYPKTIKARGFNKLKEVELSLHDAAWFCLLQNMSEKSREVAHILTCYHEQGVCIRHTKAELTNLPFPSTDLWNENVIEKYERRSNSLRICTLPRL